MTASEPCGVLLLDKAAGPTSHDVVASVRRLLRTRRVGHAGTLDPAATGLLVVLVGEATKLEPFLSSDDKTYLARVELGRETDTLDAEGRVIEEGPVPEELLAELGRRAVDASAATPRLDAALAGERARSEQIPPGFSAIKVDGVRSHRRARAGEDVRLPPRPVRVGTLELLGCGLSPTPHLDVRLAVSKGYYVRAFGRDLGHALGTFGSLSALRRLASGPFEVREAISLGTDSRPDALAARLLPLVEAATRALPSVALDPEDVTRARQGKRLVLPVGATGRVALLEAEGRRLVAIAEVDDQGAARVLRGFVGLPTA